MAASFPSRTAETRAGRRLPRRGDSFAALAVAALETLGYRVAAGEEPLFTAEAESSEPGPFPADFTPPEYRGRRAFAFSFSPAGTVAEHLSPSTPLWRWIVAELDRLRQPISAAPLGEPQAVHEFSRKLLEQYTVAGGSVHLAGCRLEPVAFVRRMRLTADGKLHETRFLINRQGTEARAYEPQLQGDLHLDEWQYSEPPRNLSRRALSDYYDTALGWQPEADAGADGPPVVVLEWCRRAVGKFEFEIGDLQLSLPFDDWARRLKAPPILCPVTGEPTYHLARTDDDRLIAAEQLARCEISGKKLPLPELVASSVSGRLVDAELAWRCPITGEPLLPEEAVACPTTGLQVAPQAIHNGRNVLLDELEQADPAQAPLARLRLDYPALEGCTKWRLARGEAIDLYVGRKLMSQVLLAVERETSHLLAAAAKGKFGKTWKPIELTAAEQS